MLFLSVIASLAIIATATPLAQRDLATGDFPDQLDIAAVAEAGPPPVPKIATDVPSQTVPYNPAALASEAAADQSAIASSSEKRHVRRRIENRENGQITAAGNPEQNGTGNLDKRNACDPQITGAGPVPTPDSASDFLSMTDLASFATSAPTPTGYVNTFKNLQAMNNALGYMGYELMSNYDVTACSNKCDAIFGCAAFNVAFERAPSIDPGNGCEDPPSTTLIKCVFWGGPVTSANAVNRGEWRKDFHVVIAGSNGYVNRTIDEVAGYREPNYIGDRAISAPADCNGQSTFVGYQYWNDGKPFDAARCGAACTAQTKANPSSPCYFFNTYVLNKNNQPQGQYCAMYKQSYDNYYATVSSVTYNGAQYSVAYSYSFTNSANQGSCTKITTCNNPGQCGSYRQCNPSQNCYCGYDTSNNVICFQDASCSGTRCSSNAGCGSGQACLSSNSCCGYAICINVSVCGNSFSPRSIFRKRSPAGSDESIGTAVYPPSNES